MKQFDYNKYLKNNPLLKEGIISEDFNPIKKLKQYAGEKGWTFSARRPTPEEDEIAREYMKTQGKEVGSIGVDKITGNINVMEPNGDFRAIISPEGEELGAWEMRFNESLNEINTKTEEDLDDWIVSWGEKNNSAVDLWGDEGLWKKIKKLVDSGVKIKVAHSENDVKKYKQLGWKTLSMKDTYSQYEALMVKK
jgi:hypothetical protein